MSNSRSDGGGETPSRNQSNDHPELDRTFYTWTTVFKVLAGQASQEEIRKYNAVDDVLKRDRRIKTCENEVDWLYQNSPIIRFMREQCRELGVDIPREKVVCVPCSNPTNPSIAGSFSGKPRASGGIDPDYGIVLCANLVHGRKDREDLLAHEMIHFYDYVRFKFDRTNLKHMACTEIRASMLSGECRLYREFWKRGMYKFWEDGRKFRLIRGFQDCVKRRATLSLTNGTNIKDLEEAGKIVDSVWDSCFADTRPFDAIYK